MSKYIKFRIPKSATKQLAIQRTTDQKKKLVISSNFLRLFGFEPGALTREVPLGRGKGFKVELVTHPAPGERLKKVYEREYKRRTNNPLEAMLDIRRQELFDCIPEGTERVHVKFERGVIHITPAGEPKKSYQDLRALVCCSSGVDAMQLHKAGFAIAGLVEWRPSEKRDARDLTETGIMSSIGNFPVEHVINEDIMTLNLSKLAADLIDTPISLMIASPVCSDFSLVKRTAFKDTHYEDGTSTLDMSYDLLRLVEVFRPATFLIEQVPGYISSDVYKMVSLRMRRWGYKEYSGVYNAPDYGGVTLRKRAYAFFSTLCSGFEFLPCPPLVTAWSIVEKHLADCRNVTHLKSIRDGARLNLLRTISKSKPFCPTILRSQSRQTKDCIVVEHHGQYFMPSEGLLKDLQGIPEDMDLRMLSKEQSIEVIGQSVDGRMHHRLIDAIKDHILRGIKNSDPQLSLAI